MKTKPRDAVLVEQRFARDRCEANHDAWALAVELARGVPSTRFDPMRRALSCSRGRWSAGNCPSGSVCSKMDAGPKRATPT